MVNTLQGLLGNTNRFGLRIPTVVVVDAWWSGCEDFRDGNFGREAESVRGGFSECLPNPGLACNKVGPARDAHEDIPSPPKREPGASVTGIEKVEATTATATLPFSYTSQTALSAFLSIPIEVIAHPIRQTSVSSQRCPGDGSRGRHGVFTESTIKDL